MLLQPCPLCTIDDDFLPSLLMAVVIHDLWLSFRIEVCTYKANRQLSCRDCWKRAKQLSMISGDAYSSSLIMVLLTMIYFMLQSCNQSLVTFFALLNVPDVKITVATMESCWHLHIVRSKAFLFFTGVFLQKMTGVIFQV